DCPPRRAWRWTAPTPLCRPPSPAAARDAAHTSAARPAAPPAYRGCRRPPAPAKNPRSGTDAGQDTAYQCAAQDHFLAFGSYPLRRSANSSLVGSRFNWSENLVRLVTRRRISPTRSEICARPSPLMKASASSATLPNLVKVVSAFSRVGFMLLEASRRLTIAA